MSHDLTEAERAVLAHLSDLRLPLPEGTSTANALTGEGFDPTTVGGLLRALHGLVQLHGAEIASAPVAVALQPDPDDHSGRSAVEVSSGWAEHLQVTRGIDGEHQVELWGQA